MQYVLTPKPKPVERGRLQGQLQIQDSAYGSMIPWILGGDMGDGSPHGVRVAGNVIFLSEIRPVVTQSTTGRGGSGGKGGGGGGQVSNDTTYYVDIGICFGEPGENAELELQGLFAATDLIYDVRTAPGPDPNGCPYGEYWNGSACVPDTCGIGEVRDPDTGLCVPRRRTGAIDPLVPADATYSHLTPPSPYDTGLRDSTLDRFSRNPAPNVRGEISTNIVAGGYSALRFYPGNETQLPDPTITAAFQLLFAADYAAGRPVTPAYLGRSYLVLQNFNVSKYGAVPNFTAILRNKTTKTAAQILTAMAARSGVVTATELDVTALAASKVRGVAYTNRGSVKQWSADTLAHRFPFDWTQKNGKLTAVMRGGAAIYDVPAAHLGFKASSDNSDTPSRLAVKQKLNETELPRRVEVKGFNPSADFVIGTGSAKRQVVTSKLERTLEINMSLTIDECNEIAQRELDTAWLEERQALGISLPHTYAGLVPTDVLNINDGGTPVSIIHSMRIKEITGGVPGALEVVGVPTDAALYVLNTFPPPTTTGILPLVPATVIGTFIDSQFLRDRDSYNPALGYYVGVTSLGNGEFRGATLHKDRGSGYEAVVSFPVPALMGRAATLLTDVSTTVDVDLYGDLDMESFTAAQVTAGEGWVYLGRETFQYQTATPVSGFANRWRLSVFSNRGGKDTGAFINTHAANERFVVLNDALRFVAVDLSENGIARNHKFVAAGMGINDVAVVSYRWNAFPPPSNISIYRDSYTTSDSTRAQQLQIVIPTRAHPSGEAVKYWVDVFSATGTAMTADAATNELIATAHPLVDGDYVAFENSGGSLPSPLDSVGHYYVRDKTADRFKVATSLGGPVLDLTSAGTGTHTFARRVRHMLVQPGPTNPAVFDDLFDTVTMPGISPVLETVQSDYFGRNVADPTKTSQTSHSINVDGSLMPGVGVKEFKMLGNFTETGGVLDFTLEQIGKFTNTWTRVALFNGGLAQYEFLFELLTTLADQAAGVEARRWKLRLKHRLPGGLYTAPGVTVPGYELPGTTYRFQMVGSEMRFLRGQTELLYRSTVPIRFPLTAVFEVAVNHKISNVRFGNRPESITTYPDTDMIRDFGITPPPQTFKFRFYEERNFFAITEGIFGEVAATAKSNSSSFNVPQIVFAGAGTVLVGGGSSFNIPQIVFAGSGSVVVGGAGSFNIP